MPGESSNTYVPQKRRVHVWTVQDRCLKIKCLEEADLSAEDNLQEEIVPVWNEVEGQRVRCFLPKYYASSGSVITSNKAGAVVEAVRRKRKSRKGKDKRMRMRHLRQAKSSSQDSKTVRAEYCKLQMEYEEKKQQVKNNGRPLVNVEQIHESVKSILECPLCCFYVIPNPVQCVNKHTFCLQCMQSCNGICPYCKSERDDNDPDDLRNLGRICLFICTNDGCEVQMSFDEYMVHKEQCAFDPTRVYQQRSRAPEVITIDEDFDIPEVDYYGRPVNDAPPEWNVQRGFGGEILTGSRFASRIIPAGAERDVEVIGTFRRNPH